MANDFKRFCKPSVAANTGASADADYTVPSGTASTALESIVIGITLANKHTSGITASVFLDHLDGCSDVFVVKDASIPTGSALEVMSGNKLVVQHNGTAGDVVRVESSRAASLDATITVLEDV